MYQKRYREMEIIGLYLGNYIKQFYLREISRLTGMPLKTVQNIVFCLEKTRVLKSTKSGKNKYFKLNLDNIQTKSFLLQSEINKTNLFSEKYPAVKTFMKELRAEDFVIVFGSFAKLKADESSDMDLLVISQDKLPYHLLPYNVHEIRMSKNSFLKSVKKGESLIKEIEENHIILNGHSFYVNFVWDKYGNK